MGILMDTQYINCTRSDAWAVSQAFIMVGGFQGVIGEIPMIFQNGGPNTGVMMLYPGIKFDA